MRTTFTLFILLVLSSVSSKSEELLTNCALFHDSPKWLSSSRVNRIADSVSRYLEWSIHRVDVQWYNNQESFEKAHALGPLAVAVSKRKNNQILLGPKVNEKNFDQVFAHELVHITSEQKYKESIPNWLEEGLANFIAKKDTVDYKALAKAQLPQNIEQLSHPMKGSLIQIQMNYMMSQALAEMIASKCDIINLLRLSVQRKMENYLDNICKIKDINKSFKEWVLKKSSSKN